MALQLAKDIPQAGFDPLVAECGRIGRNRRALRAKRRRKHQGQAKQNRTHGSALQPARRGIHRILYITGTDHADTCSRMIAAVIAIIR